MNTTIYLIRHSEPFKTHRGNVNAKNQYYWKMKKHR